MKEIDFLPEWYKTGRRRCETYRTQYIGIVGVFIVMLLWSFLTGRSISNAEARLNEMQASEARMAEKSQEYARLKTRLGQLQKRTEIIDEAESKRKFRSAFIEQKAE